MNITGLSDRGKIIKDYTDWDFRMWSLVVLTGWSHLRGYLIRKCMGVSPGQQNNGRNNEVIARRRFTVVDIT